MTSITFDTMDAARRFRDAGVDEKTAEAIVSVVRRTAELPKIEHLATKALMEAGFERTNGRIDDLSTLLFAAFGLNLAAVLGTAAFLYTVIRA